MVAFIPQATNLSKNPKPASLTYLSAGGGAEAPILVYDRSYSGETAARMNFTAPDQYFDWSTNATSQFGGQSIGEANIYRDKVRVLAYSGAEIESRLDIVYSDSSVDSSEIVAHSLDASSSFQAIQSGEVVSNPAKTISHIRTRVWSTAVGLQVVYFGGHDVRANQTIDSFVVGDGRESSWAGTPNNSISTRSQYEIRANIRRGAQFRYQAKYFLVDRRGVIMDDITEYVLPSPSISIDMLGEATKGTLSIDLTRNDIILPFQDRWISPRLTIEHPDGFIEGGDGPEGMLGIYSVEPASEYYDMTGDKFKYTGFDLLWILEQDSIHPTDISVTIDAPEGAAYLIQPLRPFRDVLKLVFQDGGFTEENGMLVLPNPANSPVAQYVWGAEVGSSRLSFITALCDTMNWRRPWITLQGQATTEPIQDLADVEPDYIFESGDNSDVRWPFEIDPEPGDMANRVRVFGKWYGVNDSLNVVVENEDRAHPFSTRNLGYHDPITGELIQKRYIDAPMIDNKVLHSIEQARGIGLEELRKRGMLPYTVRMKTRAMIRQLNEVYGLNITNSLGDEIENGQGKYWCVGWQITLGPPWEMTHNLKRIIPIFETSYGPPDEEHGYWTPTYTRKQLTKANDRLKRAERRAMKNGKINAKERKEIQDLKKRRNEIKKGLQNKKKTWVKT